VKSLLWGKDLRIGVILLDALMVLKKQIMIFMLILNPRLMLQRNIVKQLLLGNA